MLKQICEDLSKINVTDAIKSLKKKPLHVSDKNSLLEMSILLDSNTNCNALLYYVFLKITYF